MNKEIPVKNYAEFYYDIDEDTFYGVTNTGIKVNITNGLGNFDEIQRLEKICCKKQRKINELEEILEGFKIKINSILGDSDE